ncbi:MAG: hypothetical protein QOD06_3065 [Candidatus Binatota bacterium]|nr:hypothetical protein [Candidatus Binatota bacterium]
MTAWRSRIPWRLKIAAKIVLARLPVPYAFWRSLSLFKHGEMEEPEYAFGVFRTHYDAAGLAAVPGPVVLELGPGDSVSSAVAAHAYGASRTILVDSGRFAVGAVASARRMAEHLRARGLTPPAIDAAKSIEEVLDLCGAEYRTDGIESLRGLTDGSVDLVWSHAVLEHVRRGELPELLGELRRVQRPGGVGSHQIDFRDHLSGGLESLRFGSRVWESELFARSGFYTNRVLYSEMIERFRRAGFDVEAHAIERRPEAPITRASVNEGFRSLPAEDFRIAGAHLLVRRAGGDEGPTRSSPAA